MPKEWLQRFVTRVRLPSRVGEFLEILGKAKSGRGGSSASMLCHRVCPLKLTFPPDRSRWRTGGAALYSMLLAAYLWSSAVKQAERPFHRVNQASQWPCGFLKGSCTHGESREILLLDSREVEAFVLAFPAVWMKTVKHQTSLTKEWPVCIFFSSLVTAKNSFYLSFLYLWIHMLGSLYLLWNKRAPNCTEIWG